MPTPATIDRLELTTPADLYYNYCWWSYAPIARTEDKFRPVNLLFRTFEIAGIDQRAFEIVEALRSSLGLFRTVYGVKWIDGRFAWEFYFYDYKRRERELSISRVIEALRPLVRCDIASNEQLPYFMFSIDIDGLLAAGQRELDVVHMYMGNPGSTVSSGIAYGVRRDSTTLDNFYFFFDAKRQLQDAASKIACSPYFNPAALHIDQVLWPQLRNCHTICVANKRSNDTAYFSGVNVDQLLHFLTSLRYPQELIQFVQRERPRLDHLLYDVGFDYVGEPTGLRMVKSGFYGVF